MSNAGRRTHIQPMDSAASYFHTIAGELARMARKQNLPVLAYIFGMAEHEAAGLTAAQKPQPFGRGFACLGARAGQPLAPPAVQKRNVLIR